LSSDKVIFFHPILKVYFFEVTGDEYLIPPVAEPALHAKPQENLDACFEATLAALAA